MIKKTFETILKNPTIIIFLVALFAMSIVSKAVHSLFMERMINPGSFAMDTLLFTYVTRIDRLLMPILEGIFIFAPMLYFAVLTDRGTVNKGWYKEGIKRNWWRFLVVWVSVYAVHQMTISILNMVSIQTVIAEPGEFNWIKYLYLAVSLLFGFARYFVIVPVIAENSFADGLRNARIVGRRYLFRLLGVHLVVSMLLYILPSNPAILFVEPVSAVISSLAVSFVRVFMYVYSMNLYISEKNKLEPTVKTVTDSEK